MWLLPLPFRGGEGSLYKSLPGVYATALGVTPRVSLNSSLHSRSKESKMTNQNPESRLRRLWRKELRPLLITALVLFSLRSSLADWSDVPTGSMKPTMMGDNRDDSFDSRYYGTVERNRIVGRATAVALSFDRKRYWLPRWDRFFTSLEPKS